MLVLLSLRAVAADLYVPADYADVQSAVDNARPDDTIVITAPGDYAVTDTRGWVGAYTSTVADRTDVLLYPALDVGAVRFEHLTVVGASASPIQASRVELEDVTVRTSGSVTWLVRAGHISVKNASFEDVTAGAGILGASWGEVSDVRVTGASSAVFLRTTNQAVVQSVDVRCSRFAATGGVGMAFDLGTSLEYGGELAVDGVLIADSHADVGIRAGSRGHVRNVTIAGGSGGYGVEVIDAGSGSGLAVTDSVFTGVGTGVFVSSGGFVPQNLVMDDVGAVGGGYRAAFTTLLDDPLLSTGSCTDGWWPRFGSPLIDAGDPGTVDHDGSPSDIGATGGEYGLDLAPDDDGDGVPASRDCDDTSAYFTPDARDLFGDGLDIDCDGADGVDVDGDGFANLGSGGSDCLDRDGSVCPGALDRFGDAVDADCDGADGVDADGDGFGSVASGGGDCNDAEALIAPFAPDTYGDGVDDDCDGADGIDADGDGVASVPSGGVDCDDEERLSYPGAIDRLGDRVDRDCDGIDGTDRDGDGGVDEALGGDDCADDHWSIHAGAPEMCGDHVDQDCDGADLACELRPAAPRGCASVGGSSFGLGAVAASLLVGRRRRR